MLKVVNIFLNSRSIARADLDISYITSRVVVMSYPSELLESAYKTNHIEDVRVCQFEKFLY